jgi:hypothetical protein
LGVSHVLNSSILPIIVIGGWRYPLMICIHVLLLKIVLKIKNKYKAETFSTQDITYIYDKNVNAELLWQKDRDNYLLVVHILAIFIHWAVSLNIVCGHWNFSMTNWRSHHHV